MIEMPSEHRDPTPASIYMRIIPIPSQSQRNERAVNFDPQPCVRGFPQPADARGGLEADDVVVTREASGRSAKSCVRGHGKPSPEAARRVAATTGVTRRCSPARAVPGSSSLGGTAFPGPRCPCLSRCPGACLHSLPSSHHHRRCLRVVHPDPPLPRPTRGQPRAATCALVFFLDRSPSPPVLCPLARAWPRFDLHSLYAVRSSLDGGRDR